MEDIMNKKLFEQLSNLKNIYAEFGFRFSRKMIPIDPERAEYLKQKYGKESKPNYNFNVYTSNMPLESSRIDIFEKKWSIQIPQILKTFFLECGEIHFDIAFTKTIVLSFKHSVTSAQLDISLDEMEKAEEIRRSELLDPFDEEYVMPWKNTIGFMCVENGDIIAIHLITEQVIYLSHDGDWNYNGTVLGNSINEYMYNLLQVGLVGKEIWQTEAFFTEGKVGIDPLSTEAKIFRQILGLQKYI